jgi:methionine salvage enolase-phosphatase E1
LNIQIEDDLRNGISRAVPVPPNEASKEEIINALVANVESMIKADRKITSLKQLQVPVHVHILHHFCMCILVTSALAQFL